MSIIGLDPKRDKRAHQIIYGGFSGSSGIWSDGI